MQHKDNNGRNTESDNCLRLSIFTSDKRIKQPNIFFVGARTRRPASVLSVSLLKTGIVRRWQGRTKSQICLIFGFPGIIIICNTTHSKDRIMPKITSKGQITIPQVIRNKFGFIPGMDVEIIIEGNKALIVKSRDENKFMKWLGRWEKRSRRSIDHTVDQLRGRTDE